LGGVEQSVVNYCRRGHKHPLDPDHAVNVDYRASDRDPLVTVGPEIDYKIAKGVRIAVRPRKNFGKNFAVETGGGFSINIGRYRGRRPRRSGSFRAN